MGGPYENDFIDGREVPPLIVTADHVLSGTHIGTVQVESGHFDLQGTLQGTLSLHSGSSARIVGVQQGTISVGPGVSVKVSGAIEGTTSVAEGAEIVIEEGAKLAGTLQNDGLVVVRGAFGGATSGSGDIRLEGRGYIKQPRIEHGIHIYDW